MTGFGQAEAADQFAARQRRQVLAPLRLAAEGVDGHHDQRGLHAHHRAKAGIHALDLARDQAVADLVEARAAIVRGEGGTEQAERAHLAENGWVGALVAERFQHPRRQRRLRVVARGIAHQALLVA